MLGITYPELTRFLIQFGIAVSGAASLWGCVFALKSRKSGEVIYENLSSLLMWLFIAGFLIFTFNWWIGSLFLFVPDIFAHEGIVVRPSVDAVLRGFELNMPLVTLIMLLGILNIHWFFYYKELWKKYASVLWGAQFLLFSAVAALSAAAPDFLSRLQMFFTLHNWHSILTLGSVITVDYLFLATFRLHSHKKFLYAFFPIISLFIWIGLGIDFLSNFLIFEDAFRLDDQFLFIQTIVAIIIINGAILSGRINELLINFAELAKRELIDPLLKKVIAVSGSVSIVSWLTITFMDFFEFSAKYWQFWGVYLLAVVTAYTIHGILESFFANGEPAH